MDLARRHELGAISFAKDPVRYIVRSVACSVVSILFVLLLVPCGDFFWHLFKGNTVEFGGLTIPVPKPYFVRYASGELQMWRLSLGIPLFKRPHGYIWFVPLPHSRDEAVVLFESNRPLFESRMRRLRYGSEQFLQVRALSFASRPGFCIETGDPKDHQRMLQCTFKDTYMRLGFLGDEAYIPDFLALLQGVTSSQRIN
jgi:hypothetical protein